MDLTTDGWSRVTINKMETFKFGTIKKAQKAQIFSKTEKKTIFEDKNHHLENSHNAEKCKRGTLWAFSTCIQLQKKSKAMQGALWRHH